MSIAKPYIDTKSITENPELDKQEEFKFRVRKRLNNLKRDLAQHTARVKDSEAGIERFLAEVDSCFDEKSLKTVLLNHGV